MAMLEGCEIGDGSLIGMGAIVLQRAKVGANALVAAGAVVGEGMEIPGRRARRRRPGEGQEGAGGQLAALGRDRGARVPVQAPALHALGPRRRGASRRSRSCRRRRRTPAPGGRRPPPPPSSSSANGPSWAVTIAIVTATIAIAAMIEPKSCISLPREEVGCDGEPGHGQQGEQGHAEVRQEPPALARAHDEDLHREHDAARRSRPRCAARSRPRSRRRAMHIRATITTRTAITSPDARWVKKAGLASMIGQLAVPDRGQDQLVDGEREHDRGQHGLDRARVAAGDVDDEVLHAARTRYPFRAAGTRRARSSRRRAGS